MTRTQMAQPVRGTAEISTEVLQAKKNFFIPSHQAPQRGVCLPSFAQPLPFSKMTHQHPYSYPINVNHPHFCLYSSDIRKRVIYLFLITKNNQSFIPSSHCIKDLRQLSEIGTRKQDRSKGQTSVMNQRAMSITKGAVPFSPTQSEWAGGWEGWISQEKLEIHIFM